MTPAELQDPNQWENGSSTTPPPQWQYIDTDERWWWSGSVAPDIGAITFLGADPVLVSTDTVCHWEVVEPSDPPASMFDLEIVIGDMGTQSVPNSVGSGSFAVPEGTSIASILVRSALDNSLYNGVVALNFTGTDPVPTPTTDFNCECEDVNDAETLAQMRLRMMDRLGFAALRASPPPGMAALLTTFLQDSQDFLYRRYPALRTRRFFRWTMEQGVRYYGIQANDEDLECEFFLDPYKAIEGVWIVDLNGAWIPLGCGIPATWYTTVAQEGIPCRYEIRQCLEVFPAPNVDGYQLYVKGHFSKRVFTADDDKPTIDGDLVYLWALANAKAHYGQPDANSVAAQANTMLKDLVAGTHLTKRYVPGTIILPPAVMPVFLPLNGAPP